jgi:hypothetical protein
MSQRTYSGSCHCGRVKFEADIDLSAGTSKCNCTSCWKRRWWAVQVKPGDFRSIQGADELVRPGASGVRGRGGFCQNCGVTPYAWVDAAEWNDGERVSINVAALDNLPPADLLLSPVRYCDGRADNWWNPPAEARHL